MSLSDEHTTIALQLKGLCDKVDILKLNIAIITHGKGNPEFIKRFKTYLDKMGHLVQQLDEAKKLTEEYKSTYTELMLVKDELQEHIQTLNQLEANINVHVHNEEDSVISEIVSECGDDEGCSNYFTPDVNVCKRYKGKVQPNYLVFDITPLYPEEFAKIPKYMLGRLSLESINQFIDILNNTVLNKYKLLKKDPMTLKSRKLELFNKYKKEQSSSTLKATRFINEEDIAREFNKTVLNKRCNNFLTILRHVKRIHRTVIASKVYYIVDDS